MSAPVVLSVLSDVHLDAAQPRWSEVIGKRALTFLNWRLRRAARHRAEDVAAALADALAAPAHAALMLGDLVNFGLARETDAAATRLRAAAGGARVLATPGNHDALVRGWEGPLRAAWGDWLAGDDGARAFPWTARFGDVAVFGLSSAVATPPFFASGRLGRDQIGRLRAALTAAGREGLARVVALHHPPVSLGPARKGLDDAADLRAALLDAGAELVLHGHLHRLSLSWIGDGARRIPVIGAPSVGAGPDGSRDGVAAGGWLSVALDRAAGRWRATVTPHMRLPDGALAARTPLVLALPGDARVGGGDGARRTG